MDQTSTALSNSLSMFRSAIRNKRMTQALASLESYLNLSKAPWELHQRLEELRQQYNFMVTYALKGASDPERDNQYARIASEANIISELAERLYDSISKPTLYYSTLRYEIQRKSDSIASLTAEYTSLVNRSNLIMLSGNASVYNCLREKMESLEKRLFNRVWVTYPLRGEDIETLRQILTSPTLPTYFRKLICSAIMLGANQMLDEQRLRILAGIYLSGDPDLEIQALCCLLLVLGTNDYNLERLVNLPSILATLREKPSWKEDLKNIYLQFIRTRETEKITKTIREDIAPSIYKLRSDIKDFMEDPSDEKSKMDLMDPDANPEWMNLIENSELGDKLRKMSEMQQEGADIMLSSFGSLKTFPFFNDIANWFMPFHTDHTAISKIMNETGAMLNLVLQSPALCDSDKYSMVLSINTLPEAQRKMMERQLAAQEDMIKSQGVGMMFPERLSREQIANKYIQDLYRFFKLYRRKGEFNDPFERKINLAAMKELREDFSDPESRKFFADFYFKKEFYEDAFILYLGVVDELPPDSYLYQKVGYAFHQEGELDAALEWYERAEMIDPDNLWTLKRIAQLLKSESKYEEAEEYYRRMDKLKPNDISILVNLASCLVRLKRPEEALKIYFKVEFLEGENPRKSLRPIAWCSLMAGDTKRSRQYYNRIFELGIEKTEDRLNLGHLNLMEGRVEDAIKDYTEYLHVIGDDVKEFEKQIEEDRKVLENSGMDPLLIDIVCDKVLYR